MPVPGWQENKLSLWSKRPDTKQIPEEPARGESLGSLCLLLVKRPGMQRTQKHVHLRCSEAQTCKWLGRCSNEEKIAYSLYQMRGPCQR